MRKIIAIGECVLDIVFDGEQPRSSAPGGLILNTAAKLGHLGHGVTMVGEAARDRVGDIIVENLQSCGVATESIDRYTDGVTPASLIFTDVDGSPRIVRYGRGNSESFDVVWPRIDSDDILLFGGYYSIDPRVRPHLFEIVKFAVERKAIIVYAPGFAPDKEPRITRVMPSILENFEVADIVITRNRDLDTIFHTADDATAYKNHISFYAHDFINIDPDQGKIRYYHDKSAVEADFSHDGNRLELSAAAIAGLIDGLIKKGVTRFSLSGEEAEVMRAVARLAQETGQPVSEILAMVNEKRDPAAERMNPELMKALLEGAVEQAVRK